MQYQNFTLDTCLIIEVCRGNTNLVDLIKTRLDLKKSQLLINSRSIKELKKHDVSNDVAFELLSKYFPNQVKMMTISISDFLDASRLRRQCPTLHKGDDEILAFSINNKSTLITADRGLIESAKQYGVDCINYHLLHDTQQNNTISHEPQKLLKPGIKISWTAFN